MAQSETFVPEEIISTLNRLRNEEFLITSDDLNKWLRENKPRVPDSTRTRWVRAFVKGVAHSDTPSWHVRYREESSIVPVQFSALRDGRMDAERQKWREKGEIRYANISDLHRPFGDGALLTLSARILKDFEANILPCFTDWLDMDRFCRHTANPGDYGVRFSEQDDVKELVTSRTNRYSELESLSLETIQLMKEACPKDCTFINLWGNHEQWLLRDMIDSDVNTDLAQNYLTSYFRMLDNNGILWIEGEKHHWFPITKQFWVGHGHRSRTGFGRTAQGYLNLVRNSASLATGHTHRQEVVYVPIPFEGERFSAVAGTLGNIQRNYANREFSGHNWGFQLIVHPIEGSKGSHVEDVRIRYQNGYYITRVFGKEYSEQATFKYDEWMDFI